MVVLLHSHEFNRREEAGEEDISLWYEALEECTAETDLSVLFVTVGMRADKILKCSWAWR